MCVCQMSVCRLVFDEDVIQLNKPFSREQGEQDVLVRGFLSLRRVEGIFYITFDAVS